MKRQNKKTNPSRPPHRLLAAVLAILCLLPVLTVVAFAAGEDPLAPITAFKDLMVGVVQIIGVIAALYGIVQIGLSLQSHDPSQRTQGVLVLFGGILLALAPTILGYIGIPI